MLKVISSPAEAPKVDENKAKALQAALSQIEKQFGKGSIMKMGDADVEKGIQVVSTGSLGLDMALGDHQRILAVVLHSISREGHWLIARGRLMRTKVGDLTQLCLRRAGEYRCEQYRQQHDRSESASGDHDDGRHPQPSSVCSSSATANIMPDTAGTHAASATGSAPLCPNSSAIFDTTNKAKPAATPLPII